MSQLRVVAVRCREVGWDLDTRWWTDGTFPLRVAAAGAGLAGGALATGAGVTVEDGGVGELPAVEAGAPVPLAPVPDAADPREILVTLVVLTTRLAEDGGPPAPAVTPASAKGSRMRLVGVRRFGAGARWDVVGVTGVVDVVEAGGGAMTPAFAACPCSSSGTATIAAMITITSGQSRRSNRSRLSEVILHPPSSRREPSWPGSAGRGSP